jgi:hypothetical protein
MSAPSMSFLVAAARGTGASSMAGVPRRRRIDREAGRALEILGHAIEYLADEYTHRGGAQAGDDGEVRAIQLLMARNREIYLACPAVPTLRERCRNWLLGQGAA